LHSRRESWGAAAARPGRPAASGQGLRIDPVRFRVPAQARSLRRRHPVDVMTAAGEDHPAGPPATSLICIIGPIAPADSRWQPNGHGPGRRARQRPKGSEAAPVPGLADLIATAGLATDNPHEGSGPDWIRV
jgi:hypothetical protein